MEHLHEFIYKRKSTRKYKAEALAENILAQIHDFAKKLKPLDEQIKTAYQITDGASVKNLLPIKAPHYMMIFSEQKNDFLVNVGFMFQQMDLYLSSLGLGSCWLGLAKPVKKSANDLPFVIIMAFGEAIGSPYRQITEFKRKEIAEISNDSDDARIQGARLAPSATNSQHWYFEHNADKIMVYRTKLSFLKTMIYEKMNQIDIGIALCHIWLISEQENKRFSFYREEQPRERKGYLYIGTVTDR